MNRSRSCQPIPQSQQGRIRAMAVTYIAAHSNAGVSPGTEPTSSWILVSFLTAEPQWQLHLFLFLSPSGFHLLSFTSLPIPLHLCCCLLLKKKFRVCVCLFRATPSAYGGSQARGRIRATATPDPSHVCNLHHSSWQQWILTSLSEARDQT